MKKISVFLVTVLVTFCLSACADKREDFISFFGFSPDSSSPLIEKESKLILGDLERAYRALEECRERAYKERSGSNYAEIRDEFIELQKKYFRMFEVAEYFGYL